MVGVKSNCNRGCRSSHRRACGVSSVARLSKITGGKWAKTAPRVAASDRADQPTGVSI